MPIPAPFTPGEALLWDVSGPPFVKVTYVRPGQEGDAFYYVRKDPQSLVTLEDGSQRDVENNKLRAA